MDDKINFISLAVNDAQATIRAMDVKVGALLAGMLLPLPLIGKIWNVFNYIYLKGFQSLIIVLGFIFLTFWFVTIISLIRTLSAIDNPANHIINSSRYKGVFYGGGLYRFAFLDVFLNREIVKASKDVSSFSLDYPVNKSDVVSELAFEHLKLIYIRDLKIYRFRFSITIAFLWIVSGFSVFFISKYI